MAVLPSHSFHVPGSRCDKTLLCCFVLLAASSTQLNKTATKDVVDHTSFVQVSRDPC